MSTKKQEETIEKIETLEEFNSAIAKLDNQKQEIVLLVCSTSWNKAVATLFQYLEPKVYGSNPKKPIHSKEVVRMIQGYGTGDLPKDIRASVRRLLAIDYNKTKLELHYRDSNKLHRWASEYRKGNIVQVAKEFVRQPLLISTNSYYVVDELRRALEENKEYFKFTLLVVEKDKAVNLQNDFEHLIDLVGF